MVKRWYGKKMGDKTDRKSLDLLLDRLMNLPKKTPFGMSEMVSTPVLDKPTESLQGTKRKHTPTKTLLASLLIKKQKENKDINWLSKEMLSQKQTDLLNSKKLGRIPKKIKIDDQTQPGMHEKEIELAIDQKQENTKKSSNVMNVLEEQREHTVPLTIRIAEKGKSVIDTEKYKPERTEETEKEKDPKIEEAEKKEVRKTEATEKEKATKIEETEKKMVKKTEKTEKEKSTKIEETEKKKAKRTEETGKEKAKKIKETERKKAKKIRNSEKEKASKIEETEKKKAKKIEKTTKIEGTEKKKAKKLEESEKEKAMKIEDTKKKKTTKMEESQKKKAKKIEGSDKEKATKTEGTETKKAREKEKNEKERSRKIEKTEKRKATSTEEPQKKKVKKIEETNKEKATKLEETEKKKAKKIEKPKQIEEAEIMTAKKRDEPEKKKAREKEKNEKEKSRKKKESDKRKAAKIEENEELNATKIEEIQESKPKVLSKKEENNQEKAQSKVLFEKYGVNVPSYKKILKDQVAFEKQKKFVDTLNDLVLNDPVIENTDVQKEKKKNKKRRSYENGDLDCKQLKDESIRTYFSQFSETLANIMSGDEPSEKHTEFITKGRRKLLNSKHMLEVAKYFMVFKEKQTELMLKLIREQTSFFDYPVDDNQFFYDYNVLLPELCLLIFMAEHKMTREEANEYLL